MTPLGDVYEKTGASTWVKRGNVQGPAGPQGPPGFTGVDPARVKQIWNMQPGPLPLSQVVNIERANQLWIWSSSFFVTTAGAFNGLTLKVDGADAGYVGFFFNPAGTHLTPPTTMLKTAYGIGNHTVSINAGSANVGNDSGDRHSLLLIELENTQQVAQAATNPPLVSSLPPSPEDGQEVYYQNAAMASVGVVWHLRYRSASTAPLWKWEFVGGPPLMTPSAAASSLNFNTTSYAATVTGTPPTLTPPLEGLYDITIKGFGYCSGGGANASYIHWHQAGGGVKQDRDALLLTSTSTYIKLTSTCRATLLANVALTLWGRATAGNAPLEDSVLSISPIRVG